MKPTCDNNKRILSSVFCLLLIPTGASIRASAQEKPQLFVKLEAVFRQQEPAWKVERILAGNTFDPVKESILLRSRKQQASVEISIWRREQDARDVFTGESIAFDNTGGKKKVKRSFPELGDENHVWTNRGSAAWPVMKFRKENIVVSIFAPTIAIARMFASHVLAEIAAGQVLPHHGPSVTNNAIVQKSA